MNVDAINALVGTEWAYKENDCWAVVCKASLGAFGVRIEEIEIPDKSSPAITAQIIAGNALNKCWVRQDHPEAGAVAVIKDAKGRANHVGICVSFTAMLHCPGTVKNPGKAVVDDISAMRLARSLYHTIEYYMYAHNHDN